MSEVDDDDLLSLPEAEERGTVVWGYARVSTAAQDVAPQVDALRAAGVEPPRILTDTASGARSSRPSLDFLLRQLRAGDTLTIWRLDRLGRSLTHLVALAAELRDREVRVVSLTDGIDTNTATGRMMLGVLASLSEYERELIADRTAAALAARRASGAPVGRKCQATPEAVRLIHAMRAAGESYTTIAATTGLSRSIVGRIARGENASVLAYATDDDGLPFYEAPVAKAASRPKKRHLRSL